MSTAFAPAGPVVVHVGVADLDRAAQLYGTVLGGTPISGPSSDVRWWFRPGVSIALEPGGRRGVLGLEVAVADVASVARAADRLGVRCRTEAGVLRVEEPSVGGGSLAFVDVRDVTAPPRARGGEPLGTAGVHTLDHTCLAVADLPVTCELARAAGGVPVIGGDAAFGGRVLQLRFGPSKLELVAPTGAGPIARFLDRRGGRAGVQHLTFRVDDVLTSVAALDGAGFETTGTDTTSQPSWHETYVRPRAADGVLLQLARPARGDHDPLTDEQLRGVLAGRYRTRDYEMHLVEEVLP